jgi:hypothetical protein
LYTLQTQSQIDVIQCRKARSIGGLFYVLWLLLGDPPHSLVPARFVLIATQLIR